LQPALKVRRNIGCIAECRHGNTNGSQSA
jgi:hypothetical protein